MPFGLPLDVPSEMPSFRLPPHDIRIGFISRTELPSELPSNIPSDLPLNGPFDLPLHPTPAAGPTLAPVPACDVIQTNKDCYVKGETIHVSFTQCAPEEDVWVGVYFSDDDDKDNLGED